MSEMEKIVQDFEKVTSSLINSLPDKIRAAAPRPGDTPPPRAAPGAAPPPGGAAPPPGGAALPPPLLEPPARAAPRGCWCPSTFRSSSVSADIPVCRPPGRRTAAGKLKAVNRAPENRSK